jgi:hypothetical protein
MKHISILIFLFFIQFVNAQKSIALQGGVIQTKQIDINGYGYLTFKPEALQSASFGYEFSKFSLSFEYIRYGQNQKGERSYDRSIVKYTVKYNDFGWVLGYKLPKYKFGIEPNLLLGFDYATFQNSSLKFEFLRAPKPTPDIFLECLTGVRESFLFDEELGFSTGIGFRKKLFKKTYLTFESRVRVGTGNFYEGGFNTNISKQTRVGLSQKF